MTVSKWFATAMAGVNCPKICNWMPDVACILWCPVIMARSEEWGLKLEGMFRKDSEKTIRP